MSALGRFVKSLTGRSITRSADTVRRRLAAAEVRTGSDSILTEIEQSSDRVETNGLVLQRGNNDEQEFSWYNDNNYKTAGVGNRVESIDGEDVNGLWIQALSNDATDPRHEVFIGAGYPNFPNVGITLDTGDGGTIPAQIRINEHAENVDTVVWGDTGVIATFDAGLKTLRVEGAITVGGGAYQGLSNISIADDDRYAWAAPVNVGMLVLTSTDSTVGGLFMYRAAAAAAFVSAMGAGSNVETTTGALNGTTGTDGKFTVSAHTDGYLYLENRRGGVRTVKILTLT